MSRQKGLRQSEMKNERKGTEGKRRAKKVLQRKAKRESEKGKRKGKINEKNPQTKKVWGFKNVAARKKNGPDGALGNERHNQDEREPKVNERAERVRKTRDERIAHQRRVETHLLKEQRQERADQVADKNDAKNGQRND